MQSVVPAVSCSPQYKSKDLCLTEISVSFFNFWMIKEGIPAVDDQTGLVSPEIGPASSTTCSTPVPSRFTIYTFKSSSVFNTTRLILNTLYASERKLFPIWRPLDVVYYKLKFWK